MMAGLSRFDFYPRDWHLDTRDLSAAAKGIYIDLLSSMYARGGALPYDEHNLCLICGCATVRSFRPLLAELVTKDKIKVVEGHLTNGRAMEEIAKAERRQAVASHGGNAKTQSESKRELIAKVLKASPERSNRSIAATVGADHKTVAKVRVDLEASGEIPHEFPKKSPPNPHIVRDETRRHIEQNQQDNPFSRMAESARVQPEYDSNSTGTQPETRPDIEQNQQGKSCSPSPSPSPSVGTEKGIPFSAAGAAPLVSDLRKVIFDVGKPIIGGGQVNKLIAHFKADLRETHRVLLLAQEAADPRAYIGRILSGEVEPPTDWGVEYQRMGVWL
jgi:uncharacterized protein YdaU (DUF1376 family)